MLTKAIFRACKLHLLSVNTKDSKFHKKEIAQESKCGISDYFKNHCCRSTLLHFAVWKRIGGTTTTRTWINSLYNKSSKYERHESKVDNEISSRSSDVGESDDDFLAWNSIVTFASEGGIWTTALSQEFFISLGSPFHIFFCLVKMKSNTYWWCIDTQPRWTIS